MSHSFNNEAGVKAQQKLGTSQSEVEFQLTAERIKQNKDKAKKNAVFLAEVEQLAGVLLDGSQSTEGKSEANAKSGNSKGENLKNDTSEDDAKQQGLGGKDFYVDNCIPFAMFVLMMKQRLAQANLQAEMGQTLALAYAGVNKSVDTDGNCTFSKEEGGGIANQICTAIIDSGNDQANQTSIAGYGELSQGVATLGSAVVMGTMIGTPEDEKNNVTKMENVLAEEEKIPVKPDGAIGNDVSGIADEENLEGINPAALSEAIGEMEDGGYDFTEKGNHFGSTATEKAKGVFNKKTTFKYSRTENGEDDASLNPVVNKNAEGQDDPNRKITVRQVLANATASKRQAIRKNMRLQLKEAKEALKTKETEINGKRDRFQVMAKALGQAGSGGLTVASAMSITAKAQDDATKSKFDSAQTTMNKLNSDQSDSTKKARERTDSANQDLQNIIRIVGQRA